MRFVFAFTLLLLAPFRASAAEMFLLLDGIPGESVDARHAAWIAVESFSEGVSRPKIENRPTFAPLTVSKLIDKSSPLLAQRAINGRAIRSGTLELVRTAETQIRLLQVKLTNILVTSFAQSATGRSEPVDSLSLDFRTVEWIYTEIDATGRPLRDISCSWNRDTGTGTGGAPSADTDEDGLPDDYEVLYGLDPKINDAAADADRDGMSNLDEFRAGTIPNARDSVFRMSGRRTSENQVLLAWTPVEGKSYRLFVAPSPEGPFEFVRIIDSTAQSTGELSLKTTNPREFFILQAE